MSFFEWLNKKIGEILMPVKVIKGWQPEGNEPKNIRPPKGGTGESKTRSGLSLSINGKTFGFKGHSVEVIANDIYIDGKKVEDTFKGDVSIEIHGDVGNVEIDVCKSMTCRNVKNLEISTGDCHVHGNVNGDVEIMTGDLTCGDINGDVEIMNGSIRKSRHVV